MSLPKSLFQFHVKTFAKNAESLSGDAELEDFPRVMAETFDDAQLRAATHVRWILTGQQRASGGQAQTWLFSEVQADLHLPCQRCLQPVAVTVHSQQWFRFVETDEQADQEDAESDEDVLSFADADDAQALLEDDLLMAIPMTVVHDACPINLPRQSQDALFATAEGKKNPFAALASLRLPKSDETAD